MGRSLGNSGHGPTNDECEMDGKHPRKPVHQAPIEQVYKESANRPEATGQGLIMATGQPEKGAEIAELLASIDRAKAELNAKRPLGPAALQRIQDEFMVRYTYNSNAIEGSTLTLDETALVVLEGVSIGGKPLRHVLDAVGHSEAFNILLKRLKDGVALTEEFVKDMHYYVLMHSQTERGNYRINRVRISNSDVRLPDPEEVPGLMASLIEDIANSTLHPVEKAGVYHLDFEMIHPFIDGNGRTGRLLMNMLLMQQGYLPVDIKFSNRARYYSAFKSFQATNSYDEMVVLIAEYELQELNERLWMLG